METERMFIIAVQVSLSRLLRFKCGKTKEEKRSPRVIFSVEEYGSTDVKLTSDTFTETAEIGLDTGEIGGWQCQHCY